MSVFFESGLSPEETIDDMKRLLSIDLKRIDERGLVRYEFSGLGCELVLFADHGLVDDLGLEFTRYTYQCDIDVREEGVRGDTAAALRHGLAAYVFDRIARGRRWPAMVVFNLQELVESFDPKSEGHRPN